MSGYLKRGRAGCDSHDHKNTSTETSMSSARYRRRMDFPSGSSRNPGATVTACVPRTLSASALVSKCSLTCSKI